MRFKIIPPCPLFEPNQHCRQSGPWTVPFWIMAAPSTASPLQPTGQAEDKPCRRRLIGKVDPGSLSPKSPMHSHASGKVSARPGLRSRMPDSRSAGVL